MCALCRTSVIREVDMFCGAHSHTTDEGPRAAWLLPVTSLTIYHI
jgi:hypothetical protein